MSGETWTVYGLKFGLKVGVKICLNNLLPGLGSTVDFAAAAKNFYDGDVTGVLVNTLSGVADLVTLGLSSAVKDVMRESGKDAVVQGAKETAKTAGKQATNKVGKELGKQLATGTITSSGKDAAITSAKAMAKSAAKEATKKVGQQAGEDLAKGVVQAGIDEVFFDGTKNTFKSMGTNFLFSTISSGGHEVRKTIFEDTVYNMATSTARGAISQSTKEFSSGFAKTAAKQATEAVFNEYYYKTLGKDLGFACVKGMINSTRARDEYGGTFNEATNGPWKFGLI